MNELSLVDSCNKIINTLNTYPNVLGVEQTNGIVFDLVHIRENANQFETKGEEE